MSAWTYPLDTQYILRHYRAEKRRLTSMPCSKQVKIAILGGSTTAQLKDILFVFLMQDGIKPEFYESQYNQYYQDIMFANEALQAFQPDIIYIHTTSRNIQYWPLLIDTSQEIEVKLDKQFQHFRDMWDKIENTYKCSVIQNNFELFSHRMLGNLDSVDGRGYNHFILELNRRMAEYAQTAVNFHINDINYLAGSMGLAQWYDENLWYAYKYAMSLDALAELAYNLSVICKAMYGYSKKCLVTDLDNTLWGGVIGDDGVEHIQLGSETPLGEAYLALQRYMKQLKQRGIILAVASKNEDITARQGFGHPDSVLTEADFASFIANWENKHHNLQKIASELSIGLDSMVFLDDNPAERQLVAEQLPVVTVPNIGSDITQYIKYLSCSGYFEPIALSAEDLKRSQYYQENIERAKMASVCDNYDDFLRSLEMRAEVGAFKPVYLERITQLINKTNQFNLTTRRYTLSEVTQLAGDNNYLTVYGRLEDKFGDNGVVSAIIACCKDGILHIDLWVMSCRVLKRGLETAMFDSLVKLCQQYSIALIQGYYYKTPKNAMVSEHYRKLGFRCIAEEPSGNSTWQFMVTPSYVPQNQWLEVTGED